MTTRGRPWLALLALAALGSPAAGLAQTEPDGPLAGLAFMAGCWEGSFEASAGPGVIEEHYTAPSTNLMLGTTRYLRDGAAVMFEFTRIAPDSAGVVVLTPYPRGVPSEHGFRATSIEPGRAVFEAPEHDFPKRIAYTVEGAGLVARIDDGTDDGPSSTWELQPSDCGAR